jgi:hypothetical protein
MRHTCAMFRLLGSVFALLLVAIAPPPHYAGRWTLDLKSSTNLPPYYVHVVSHTMDVTQSESALDLVVTVANRHDKQPHSVKVHYELDRDGRPRIKDQQWELSNDGLILTIRRVEVTPRGKFETEMIFLRG